MHLTPALPLRSEASPRPSPQTAARWGTSSPSASMPSTPFWTPGSSSSSVRLSSSVSSSGYVARVLVLPTGTCRRPFLSPHQGEETHGLPLPSRLRMGTGYPCQPGVPGRWHHWLLCLCLVATAVLWECHSKQKPWLPVPFADG